MTSIVFVILISLFSCSEEMPEIAPPLKPEIEEEPDPGRSLREIVAEKFPSGNVFVGATGHQDDITEEKGEILKNEFSYMTPANDFKQPYVHPEPGHWKWAYPDNWVAFARANDQNIRIHGPISPQCSPWAKEDDRTGEELLENMEEYITELYQRYNDERNVVWMDVVNETALDDGSWFGPKEGTSSWQNPWPLIGYTKDIPDQFPHLGDSIPTYIIRAFELANEHGSNKKLIINQHGSMNDELWNKIKDLLLYLRSLGLRVDGLGWQGHIKYHSEDDQNSWSDINSENIRKLGELIDWAHENDFEFHVTENNIHDLKTSAYSEEVYAAIYKNILATTLSRRNSGVVTWNLWTIADIPHYNQDHLNVVGIWDEELKPRMAYWEVQQLLEDY